MSRKHLKLQPAKAGSFIKAPEHTITPEFSEYPSFSLRYLSPSRDYCLGGCPKADRLDLLEALHKLSKMTWIQISSADRQKKGSEKIDGDSLRPALPAHVTPEVPLLAIHFSGLKRMIGYRDHQVFQILVLDPFFKAYKH